MKATMSIENLRDALQKVSLIKGKKLPVLSNALLEFADGKAKLAATDSERAVVVEIDSTNDGMSPILLPIKTTTRFAQGANGNVVIEVGKSPQKVSLSREGVGDFNLTVSPTKDFPPMPHADNLEWHTLDAKWFCQMLRIVAIACSKKENRPVLTGVSFKDGAIVAVDGSRLVVLRDKRLTFGLGDKQIIVPLDTVNIIPRLFAKETSLEISYEVGQTNPDIQRVYFRAGNTTLVSQLIQGTYPDYTKLIPEEFICKVSFSVPLMSQRLGMIDTKTLNAGIVRLVFQKTEPHNEHECLITGGNIEGDGEYLLRLPVKIETEKVGKIAFNYSYVMDAIKPFSVCDLEITSVASPGKFTGDIEGLTIVVMPMFVQW